MHALRHSSHRRTILWGMVLALLLSQALGLAHRVLHAPGLKPAGEALFGQHDGGDCRLFDQLAHGDALAAALPALPPAPPQAPPEAALPAGTGAVHAALYLARAPPRG